MDKGVIIYIGGFELPDKNAAAHRVLNNAKIFKKLGYKVVFIDVDKLLNSNNDIYTTKKKIYGFDCWSIPYPKDKKDWIKYLSSIAEFKKVYIQYSNVKKVICYNYQALPLYRLKRFCKTKHVDIIGDCTEWYDARGNGFIFYILKSIDTFWRMRILNKQLDGLIVISNYLESYYSKSTNIVNLPPLVDKNDEKWEMRTISLNNPNNKINLVYAGSPGNKDRIDKIIEVLYELDYPFEFNIIGINKKEYLKYYPYHINKIEKMDKKLNFMGKLSHLECLEYIKKADFSCFFRNKNFVTEAGFPTKFVESISCGTPVITNKSSNISKYIKNGENGILINKLDMYELKEVFNSINNRHIVVKDKDLFDYRMFVEKVDKFFMGR